ncbi:hypothetical protein AVEN_253140-1, partial [Araneus ventricosus]
ARTERRAAPCPPFLQALRLMYQLDRHGTISTDRTSPHAPVPATITTGVPVG